MDLSQSVTQEKGQMEPDAKNRCCVHEIEECHDDSWIEDLNEQVQSLFYHRNFEKMMARWVIKIGQ